VKSWGLSLFLVCASTACLAQQRLVDPGSAESAHPAALEVLRHLAEGNIDAAAKLSNAPQRRLEVLRDYRRAVGEDEFRRIFAEYLNNHVVAEVAIGPRRLLVWQLPEADERLAGQFYVLVDGRFVMDDVPSPVRSARMAWNASAVSGGRISRTTGTCSRVPGVCCER
jgi:hypothetical protein